MLERSVGWLLTVLVVGFVSYQLAWHNDFLDQIGGVGFFLLLIVTLVVAGIMLAKPNRITIVLAFLLGMAVMAKGADVWQQIEWSGVILVLVTLVVLAGLWYITIKGSDFGRPFEKVKNFIGNARQRTARTP
jgi:hypothetical protein